jgi:HAD superfamily hydrolase (TIGR01490 family)
MSDKADVVFLDVDQTLLDKDSDVSWKRFLVGKGLAPQSDLEEADRYWELYRANALPEEEFLAFQLRQFVGRTPAEMETLGQRHYEECLADHICLQARRVIEAARRRGAPTAVISATNRVIIDPVARAAGVDDALVTELEVRDGRYTGRIAGDYCVKERKVARAQEYCRSKGLALERAAYFGDSKADVPLLEAVGFAIAVNPDEDLLAHANARGWRVERWGAGRDESSNG